MLEINFKKLKNNILLFDRFVKKNFKQFKNKPKLMAIVKSNAYGHGLVEVSKVIENTKVVWLGVDNIDEGLTLREAGIKMPVLILGYTPKNRLKELLSYNLSQIVYDKETIKEMEKIKSNSKFNIHLKIDTGMSRQGVLSEQVGEYINFIRKNNNLRIEGIMTHFANADELKDRSFPNLQLKRFIKVIKDNDLSGLNIDYFHAFNTPATLTFLSNNINKQLKSLIISHLNLFRIGIGLYGLWPSIEFKNHFKNFKIKPVLSWKTHVAQVKSIKKGSLVGYGITEGVKRDSKIAILPVGYFGGLPRAYSSVGYVLIGGERCKILGRISMNLTVADITNLKKPVKVWDEVVIIGKQGKNEITAEELAEKCGTISYEIVSRINPLLPRIYIKD